jgi:hypothetical protein
LRFLLCRVQFELRHRGQLLLRSFDANTLSWASDLVIGLFRSLFPSAMLHACNLDCYACDACERKHGRDLCDFAPHRAITEAEAALQGLSFHLSTWSRYKKHVAAKDEGGAFVEGTKEGPVSFELEVVCDACEADATLPS